MQINHTIRSLFLAIAVLSVVALAGAPPAAAQVSIAVSFGPPALPIYEQPPCPQEGFLWTPGYWAYDYDDADYYWVPGTWVEAPEVGYLWTPGYWGWGGDGFLFHEGYWGQEVGFYGGIVYGFGYFGEGYEGGRWDHDRFFYNRSVNNVNVTNIHNVYNTTVINNTTVNRVSYNGGNGGVAARPTPQQEAVANQRHIPPVAVQTQHMQAARSDPQQRASMNQGKPAVAATPKPGELRNTAAVPAKQAGAPYHPPANRGGNAQPNNQQVHPEQNTQQNNQQARPQQNNGQGVQPGNSTPRPNPMHASELPPRERPALQSTGNPQLDNKYQQQQQKLAAQQDKEQQKLQQRQEQDHQRLAQQNADEAKKQQVEQRHQQQTQQLQQKYEQQQQKMQQRQRPPNSDPNRPPQ